MKNTLRQSSAKNQPTVTHRITPLAPEHSSPLQPTKLQPTTAHHCTAPRSKAPSKLSSTQRSATIINLPIISDGAAAADTHDRHLLHGLERQIAKSLLAHFRTLYGTSVPRCPSHRNAQCAHTHAHTHFLSYVQPQPANSILLR